MVKSRLVVSFAALAWSGMAVASGNLLSNGSFESGFAGWQLGLSANPQNVPVVVPFSAGPSTTPGAFNSVVPQNTGIGSGSPDAAGSKAALFVEDEYNQTLSQAFTVTQAGLFSAGFSMLVTQPGFAANSLNARLNITGGGSGFQFAQLSTNVASSVAGTWQNFATTFNAQPGTYIFTFSFTPFGENNIGQAGYARDLAVDQAFVAAVPEPETYALALVALLTCAGLARLQRRSV